MSDNKKYYYLKLKEDFFDSEEMKVLESMPNGVEYQNVYLKMCLLSLKSDGALMFKNMIPYSLEMLSSVLRVKIDTIKAAIEIFSKMELITIADTETIYMSDIQTLVGQSSTEAERIMRYRKSLKEKQHIGQIESDNAVDKIESQINNECTNVVQMYTECTEKLQNCTPEIRDKSIEIRDKNSSNEVTNDSNKKAKRVFVYHEYTDFHSKVYNELLADKLVSKKEVEYNYGLIGKRLKALLSNPYFTKEKIFQGILNAKGDQSSLSNNFALEPMLTEANMTRLIEKRYISLNKTNQQNKSGNSNYQQVYTDEEYRAWSDDPAAVPF